ncbi:DUF481 domain-containing protein [bacterium]|nr:DUF481 domain-containing protein [bacterium]
MKHKLIIAMAALMTFSTGNSYAQDNNVVLNYNYVSLGYSHDSIDTDEGDLSGNGLGVSAGIQTGNFTFSVFLANTWLDIEDANILEGGGTVSYVIQATDKLNIRPGIGLRYAKLHDWTYYYDDELFITPKINLEYAATESLELNGTVGYSNPTDSDYDGTLYGRLGLKYAINQSTGVGLGVSFSEDAVGVGAYISFHR